MKLIVICGSIFLSVFGQESTLGPNDQTTTHTPTPFETTMFPENPSNDTIDPTILQGQRAQPGEIPWQAYLRELTPQGGACGGSLIHPVWVLTAAHCIMPNARTEVYMGSTNIHRMTYKQVATRRFVHPQYDRNTLINDVALLRLPIPASGQGIVVIPLVPDSVGDLNGVVMHASGFGLTRYGGQTSPDLLKATLRGISNMECAMTFRHVFDSTLCANWYGVQGQSVCDGDSGGPLVVRINGRPFLAGVVSFVTAPNEMNRCDLGGPQGFARVTSFRGWVENTMAQN